MLTGTVLFVLAAFVCTIAAALGKCPVWIPVVIICLVLMLMVLPR